MVFLFCYTSWDGYICIFSSNWIIFGIKSTKNSYTCNSFCLSLFLVATQGIKIYYLYISLIKRGCCSSLSQNVSLFHIIRNLKTDSFFFRWENRFKSVFHNMLSYAVISHLVVNFIFTLFMLSIAATNYPGGAAISRLHRIAKNETFVYVHIDNLAAQTGVSRFTQINNNWR